MIYQKDSIEISSAQDLPLLRQIMLSQYATHDQIYEFMKFGCYERSKNSFNWRIRRLTEPEHQFVVRRYLPAVSKAWVYSIGQLGIQYLRGTGECCDGNTTVKSLRRAEVDCSHSVELNQIHLALLYQNVLEEWIYETEVRATNELSCHRYAKDYDAIVTVRVGSVRHRFALEYERSPKTARHYAAIRDAIDSEEEVSLILYLTVNDHLESFLLHCLSGGKKPLYIGQAKLFSEDVLESPVTDVRTGQRLKFRDALDVFTPR